MRAPQPIGNAQGFSLIEIIVVITVAAVMFAMMFAYFNRTFMDSALPVVRLNQSMGLTQVAERITEHYAQDRTAGLATLQTNLNTNPAQYGNDFTVVTNQFIVFTANNDEPDTGGTNNILKITIRHNETNETLTLLLTQW